jgi:hypothetical protein
MQISNVDDGDALGASMLEEIRRTAERRLRQIEPLIEEAEQLRGVLEAIAKRPAANPRTVPHTLRRTPMLARAAPERATLHVQKRVPTSA